MKCENTKHKDDDITLLHIDGSFRGVSTNEKLTGVHVLDFKKITLKESNVLFIYFSLDTFWTHHVYIYIYIYIYMNPIILPPAMGKQ